MPADGGEPRRLSDPKAPAYDISPAFSPDGRLLAYASCGTYWSCDVFVQQLDTGYARLGEPRRITREGRHIGGLAWSRDAASVVYSASASWGMNPRLRRVGVSGTQPPELLELAGLRVTSPSIARTGHRLAFSKSMQDRDIWRCQTDGVLKPVLTSSLDDYNPQFSPDGSRIAFQSDRSGEVVEIWTADADGSRLTQVTKGPGRGQGTPRWSPDGRLIAFDSLGEDGKPQIYVVDATGGRPRRVSSGTSNDAVPSFSRDGRWINFYSSQTGRNEVWRVPFHGGPAQRMTENGGETAFESTDGKTLFYTKLYSGPLFARSLVLLR